MTTPVPPESHFHIHEFLPVGTVPSLDVTLQNVADALGEQFIDHNQEAIIVVAVAGVEVGHTQRVILEAFIALLKTLVPVPPADAPLTFKDFYGTGPAAARSAERRAKDQDTAVEQAFVEGDLPDEDRRTTAKKGKK